MMTTMLRRKRGYSQRSLPSSLYRAPREPTEPFHVTVLKVGSTILGICTVLYLLLNNVAIFSSHRYDHVPYREHLVVKHTDTLQDSKDDNKVAILPTFTLTEKSEHDAFGISKQHLSNVNSDAPQQVVQFLDAAEKLQREFSQRYGGEVSARCLLERSLVVLKKDGDSLSPLNAEMAFRIHQARQNSGVLNMAFGGSSAVAGYGNFYHQSFPFILENMLKDALELLGLTLKVRNGAVEHTAVFPYTWCKANFLGDHLDVSSIDFGNIRPQQLETVVRNMLGPEQEKAPILVFRDSFEANNNERISLLQR